MPSCLRIPCSAHLGLVLTVLLLLPRTLMAQCGTAPTGDPAGFGIDGDLDPSIPTATTDWMSIINSNGTPTSASTLHGADGYNGSDLAFSTTTSRFGGHPHP